MRYRRWLRMRARSADDVAREIDDELSAHVEMHAAELLSRGASADRARHEARRRFGDYEHARGELIRVAQARRMRHARMEWLDALRQDVLYALRRSAQRPWSSLGAITLLALGVGLSTSVFTLVNGVLIASLPFPDPDRLYAVATLDSAGNEVPVVSIGNWVDWQSQSKSIAAGALWRSFRTPVTIGDVGVRATVTSVTGNFFGALAMPLAAGRSFDHAEAQGGAAGVVVSEGFWRTQLGQAALPISLGIAGRQRDVIGVVRAGFAYPIDTDVWQPIVERPASGMERNFINYAAVVRLRPEVSLQQADEELDAISHRIRVADPAALYLWGVTLEPLKSDITGDASLYLPLLMASVMIVLLIACANLAGLNLGRGTVRRREMAVRSSLGAGRGRLIRQLLTEHLVIALVGGAAGVLVARALVRATLVSSGSVLPRAAEIVIDVRVLLFALAVAVFCGLVTGMLPALRLSRAPLREQLGAMPGARGLPGRALVLFEVTAAIILLISGMLLMRSYQALLARDLGYDTADVVVADVVLPRDRYGEANQSLAYWDQLLAAVRRVPGVLSAGVANWVPMGGGAMTFVEAEDRTEPNPGGGYRAVGEDYFNALGIHLLAGRTIDRRDDQSAARVVVINRAMAEMLWPGENPIGRRVRAPVMEGGASGSPSAPWLTVVGVVADIRHWGIETNPAPELYVSYRQVPVHASSMSVAVRTRTAAPSVLAALHAAVREVDPRTPADIETMEQRLSARLHVRRLILGVVALFGALALLLACIGLYSVLSIAVAQRTREIAIRVALGAEQRALLGLVFGSAMKTLALGALAGCIGAWLVTRFLARLLVQVSPADPLSFVTAPAVLLAAGALAAFIPARRATRLSPLAALKPE